MPDFIPASDAVFNGWAAQFKAYATANAVALGLSPANVADLAAASGAWNISFGALEAAKAAARGAVGAKDTDRRAYVEVIRTLTAIIQANPAVTDQQRGELGITIAKTPGVIPVPVDAPAIFVDFSHRTQHTIHWGTSPEQEDTNRKPEGVLSSEIRRHIGDLGPGIDQDDFEFVAIDTKSPYVANMSGLGGQIVHWTCRYLNAKGEPGPWCETIAATVTTT